MLRRSLVAARTTASTSASATVIRDARGEPTAGTQPRPDDAYLNSSFAGAYCDGALGTGTFRLDEGCWTGYQPLFRVTATD